MLTRVNLRLDCVSLIKPVGTKVFPSQLVSYHASHYINSAAANKDTFKHLLYWLVPRLQVEYYSVRIPALSSSLAGLQFPSSDLSNCLTAHSCKSAEGHVLKECSSVCYVCAKRNQLTVAAFFHIRHRCVI